MTAALVRKVLAMRRSIPKPPKNAHEKVHLNKLAKLGTFDQVVEAALAVEFAQKLKRKKKRRDKKKRAGMPAVGNRIVPSDGTEAEMAAAAEPEAPASVMAQARSLMAAEAEEEDRALSPLTLKYTIPMEYGQHKREVYELEVEVEDPNRDAMAPLFDDIEPEVRAFDSQLAVLKREIDESREKREFMLNFARDPREFLACWLASQARENDAGNAEGRLSEEQRAAAFYNDHRTVEAVLRYYGAVLSARTRHLKGKLNAK